MDTDKFDGGSVLPDHVITPRDIKQLFINGRTKEWRYNPVGDNATSVTAGTLKILHSDGTQDVYNPIDGNTDVIIEGGSQQITNIVEISGTTSVTEAELAAIDNRIAGGVDPVIKIGNSIGVLASAYPSAYHFVSCSNTSITDYMIVRSDKTIVTTTKGFAKETYLVNISASGELTNQQYLDALNAYRNKLVLLARDQYGVTRYFHQESSGDLIFYGLTSQCVEKLTISGTTGHHTTTVETIPYGGGTGDAGILLETVSASEPANADICPLTHLALPNPVLGGVCAGNNKAFTLKNNYTNYTPTQCSCGVFIVLDMTGKPYTQAINDSIHFEYSWTSQTYATEQEAIAAMAAMPTSTGIEVGAYYSTGDYQKIEPSKVYVSGVMQTQDTALFSQTISGEGNEWEIQYSLDIHISVINDIWTFTY